MLAFRIWERESNPAKTAKAGRERPDLGQRTFTYEGGHMATAKLHKSLIIERRSETVVTTLCRRVSNKGDDMNVADIDDQVTCKFCLRRMRQQANKQ
jgi:hypothetical protein